MDFKERLTRFNESLKTDPIPMFDHDTVQIGWSFLWRQLVLGAPVYALAIWNELGRGISSLPGAVQVLLLLLLVPWVFWSLAAAEAWRRTGRTPVPESGPALVGMMKEGFSLWWRIIVGWMRFVVPMLVLGVLVGLMGLDEDLISVLGVVIWIGLSILTMGFAVRQWARMQALVAGTWAPPAVSSGPTSSANPLL